MNVGVLLAESVDTASGVNKTLLAGVERMTVRTNFHGQLRASRGHGIKFISTCTADMRVEHLGMDIFFHCNLQFQKREET